MSMDLLFGEMIRNKNYTVNSDPDYPQFMVYDEESGYSQPMTEENMATESWSEITFFNALKVLFRTLFELIKQTLAAKFA